MEIQGLLLCAECENQLKVCKYRGGYGFFIVEPCTHCATQPAVEPATKAWMKRAAIVTIRAGNC